jgi:hypothetical protein
MWLINTRLHFAYGSCSFSRLQIYARASLNHTLDPGYPCVQCVFAECTNIWMGSGIRSGVARQSCMHVAPTIREASIQNFAEAGQMPAASSSSAKPGKLKRALIMWSEDCDATGKEVQRSVHAFERRSNMTTNCPHRPSCPRPGY